MAVPHSFHAKTFPVAQRIWSLAVRGTSIRGIAGLLTDDGAPAADGLARRPSSTTTKVFADPVYCGVFD